MFSRPVSNAFGTLLAIGFASAFFGVYILGIGAIALGVYMFRGGSSAQRERAYHRQLASEEFDIVAEQVDNRISGNAFANHWYGIQSQDSSTADFVDTLFGVER